MLSYGTQSDIDWTFNTWRWVKEKFNKLIEWFKTVGKPIIVSFSGGVDSSVVLAVAVLALDRENVVAVTAVSPTYPEDLYWAKEIVKIFNVKHILIESDELENPNSAILAVIIPLMRAIESLAKLITKRSWI